MRGGQKGSSRHLSAREVEELKRRIAKTLATTAREAIARALAHQYTPPHSKGVAA